MITLEKLNMYKKYQGDVDHYSRIYRNRHGIMEKGDFALIDSLAQDIGITENALASESYIKSLNKKLSENCDSDETIAELKRLVKGLK